MPIAQQTASAPRERRQAPIAGGVALDAASHAVTLAADDSNKKGKQPQQPQAQTTHHRVSLPPPVVVLPPPISAAEPSSQQRIEGAAVPPIAKVPRPPEPTPLAARGGRMNAAPDATNAPASSMASESDQFLAALRGPGSVAGAFTWSPTRVADETLSGVGDAARTAARDFRRAALTVSRAVKSRIAGATTQVVTAFNHAAASVLTQLDDALNDALATLSSYGYGVADEILLTAAGSDASGTATAAGGVLAAARQQHHPSHHEDHRRHAPAEQEEDDPLESHHHHQRSQPQRSRLLHHPLSPVEMTEIKQGAPAAPPPISSGAAAKRSTLDQASSVFVPEQANVPAPVTSAFGSAHERVAQMRQNLQTQAEQQAVDAKVNTIDAATAADYLGPAPSVPAAMAPTGVEDARGDSESDQTELLRQNLPT